VLTEKPGSTPFFIKTQFIMSILKWLEIKIIDSVAKNSVLLSKLLSEVNLPFGIDLADGLQSGCPLANS
jgi:hypothetical protein